MADEIMSQDEYKPLDVKTLEEITGLVSLSSINLWEHVSLEYKLDAHKLLRTITKVQDLLLGELHRLEGKRPSQINAELLHSVTMGVKNESDTNPRCD